MTQQFDKPILRRNDRCVCNSGKKFKHCHGRPANSTAKKTGYIDNGEEPVRWVITDHIGTSFFSTKDNEIIVFTSRADATAVATMPVFQEQQPGEINVAGVGQAKWQHLQSKLQFVEAEDVAHAVRLIQARIEAYQGQMAVPEVTPQTSDAQQDLSQS